MSDRDAQWAERRKQQEAETQRRGEVAARRRELMDSLAPWQRHVAAQRADRTGDSVDHMAVRLFGHQSGWRPTSESEPSAASPSPSSSSPSGFSLPKGPTYEEAKAEWETFKSGFAERIQSITDEMSAKGAQAWGDARSYVSSGLRTPEREEAYGQRRPEVAEGWDGSGLDHYRQHGRAEGTPYINPEQPRGYGL